MPHRKGRSTDYGNMSKTELQREARKHGIEGRSSMSKEELQSALKGSNEQGSDEWW